MSTEMGLGDAKVGKRIQRAQSRFTESHYLPQITWATSLKEINKSVCINNRREREAGEMQPMGGGGGQWLERDEKSMDKQVRGRLQKGSQRGEKLSI